MTDNGTETFDYVIVGAGSAGSLLASRLAETPGVRICLLEAGPKDRNPFIHIPAGFIKVIFDPKLTWGFETEPNATINDRVLPVLQGRVVGGSSSINGMVYVRGQAQDFDSWAKAGNADWSYNDVLPYFRRTECLLTDGDSRYRGSEGKMPVTHLQWKNELVSAFIEASSNIGLPPNDDYNGARQEGVGVYQYNIGRGRRQGTAQAYLRDSLRSGAIDLRTHARATELVFEGSRVSGVRYTTDKGHTTQTVSANCEVILCGGAINTPRLLQVSGIGDPDHLAEIGAPAINKLPGVGQNLRDHYTPRFTCRVEGAVTVNEIVRGPRMISEGVRWLFHRPSILTNGPVMGVAFCKSDSSIDRPDLVITFTPGSFKEGFLGKLDSVPGMTLGTWQLRPESTGYVRAKSRDLFEAPAIQPNYLSAEKDQNVVVAGQKIIRRILSDSAMAPYSVEEVMPGKDVQDDDALLDYARRQGLGGYHYCGTCRMGAKDDAGAVVDARLKVHGLEGLRVVDASVMPNIVSGNINAATMMIAERAAEFIREDRD
ncbi:MAG: GMC family oxidoreductase N-terminal domain-containing protein [Gammaproteobacteria bacterium]|nr:GMC family oxidoreductase N-terminal domain-containing protein [Gammaproteobacteria bacterium]MDH3509801.1 GMC family oxidoreductase N-terminal domain-containing protein [Gammaproteobacteria bacterium]